MMKVGILSTLLVSLVLLLIVSGMGFGMFGREKGAVSAGSDENVLLEVFPNLPEMEYCEWSISRSRAGLGPSGMTIDAKVKLVEPVPGWRDYGWRSLYTSEKELAGAIVIPDDCMANDEYTEYILGDRFIGDVFVDMKNAIVYIHAENK